MTENVIGELIGTFIIGVLLGTYRRFIFPFIKEHFTERVRLKKLWRTEVDFGSGRLHGMKLELRKLGNDVTGEIEFVSGRHLGKKYPIKGYFRSDILTFVYSPSDPVSTSQGSGTFKRLKDGELLKGHFAYFSQDSNQIRAIECEFVPVFDLH